MSSNILRSEGITESEKYLQRLCEKSFLRLWSYPGIYRNQFVNGEVKGGKEVCDQLIVFENHILIFSDKYINFPNTSDIDVDWSRWVRKAVLESGKQLFGAERWIKNYPDRLFIDRECNQSFPIDLPSTLSAKFHRVVVAHGAAKRCKQELGGSGSLMIHSGIVGKDHLLKEQLVAISLQLGKLTLSVDMYIYLMILLLIS